MCAVASLHFLMHFLPDHLSSFDTSAQSMLQGLVIPDYYFPLWHLVLQLDHPGFSSGQANLPDEATVPCTYLPPAVSQTLQGTKTHSQA